MNPEVVTKALETFADFLMTYLVALAAVGALTMALIEAYKKLFDSRTKFHFNFVRQFIEGDEEARATSELINHNLQLQNSYSDTFSELIHLVSGIELEKAQALSAYERGNLLAIFSLESASMLGKIQDAVDAAIDNPNEYPNLFIFATSGTKTVDAQMWVQFATAVAPVPPATPPLSAQTRSELYTRFHQLAKRKLDRLQLQLTTRWTNLNQLYANILGISVLFAALLWINRNRTLVFSDVLIIFIASTVGGILSPIAKDMISWLQKVKSRG